MMHLDMDMIKDWAQANKVKFSGDKYIVLQLGTKNAVS